jgi:aryl-alcohol dehydrogenase-like predicted oxidoreductase
MAWTFQNSGVDTILVGARSARHLDNAFQALETEFRPEWLTEIAQWD